MTRPQPQRDETLQRTDKAEPTDSFKAMRESVSAYVEARQRREARAAAAEKRIQKQEQERAQAPKETADRAHNTNAQETRGQETRAQDTRRQETAPRAGDTAVDASPRAPKSEPKQPAGALSQDVADLLGGAERAAQIRAYADADQADPDAPIFAQALRRAADADSLPVLQSLEQRFSAALGAPAAPVDREAVRPAARVGRGRF